MEQAGVLRKIHHAPRTSNVNNFAFHGADFACANCHTSIEHSLLCRLKQCVRSLGLYPSKAQHFKLDRGGCPCCEAGQLQRWFELCQRETGKRQAEGWRWDRWNKEKSAAAVRQTLLWFIHLPTNDNTSSEGTWHSIQVPWKYREMNYGQEQGKAAGL